MKKTISSPEIFIDPVCMMPVASGNKDLMFTYPTFSSQSDNSSSHLNE